MGKNQRHKKDIKAEKAKIKLKQVKTKFLPKGLNVTKTTFKIKPIVIPEQLKQKDFDEVLSRRKLNVKDLLSRIKHYNENIRHSACIELGDMVKIHTEDIQQHLAQICLAVSSLIQDRERKVRKVAIKCIDTILEHIPHMKLLPFFDYFFTNLRCAMTNIDKGIQEDSLLFLDCFIKKDYDLIRNTSNKLLSDFLSLISKFRSDSQLERTLTLNLGSNITSVAWRIQVLSRLHAILRIMVIEDKQIKNSKSDTADGQCNINYGLYKYTFGQLLEAPVSDVLGTSKSDFQKNSFQNFDQQIVSILPLLYETWLEVIPEEKVKKPTAENTILDDEAASLLTSVMNIIHLLSQYIKQVENEEITFAIVFVTPQSKRFFKHLLSGFPYSHSVSKTKKKENNLNNLESSNLKCFQENLQICHLYSILIVNGGHVYLKKYTQVVMLYIIRILNHKQGLKEENVNCLLSFLKECFDHDSANFRNFGMDLHLLLENTIIFYENGRISYKEKNELFWMLSNIEKERLCNSEKYQNWLASLPNILCAPTISDSSVLVLLQISKKHRNRFYDALVDKLPDILDNLDKAEIVVSDSITKEDVKRNIANIFYYIPNRTNLDIIYNYIERSPLSTFKHYFSNVLCLRREFMRS